MPVLKRLRPAALLPVIAVQVFAQSTQSLPAFEVASVRTVQDDTRTWALRQTNPARYRSLSNVNQLIMWAWKLRGYQILGSPAWIFKDRFEIQAATGRLSSTDEERLMVQRLLAERFGLKVHRETREMPVYLLVVGKNGPKMETAKEGGDPAHRGINIAAGAIVAREGTMENFVDVLTTNLDRPVLDVTNLKGSYDFTLTWDPPATPPGAGSWSPIGPALFTPIRELGLRLDPQKAQVEVLVIDSIDHPNEN